MIHIDDLVRQRLTGGEEPERPGAWLTMRELLDREMPAAVASGTNWRRVFGYFTGLLLLTTASVGSYRLYNRNAIAGNGIAERKSATRNAALASNGTHVASDGIEGTRPATPDHTNAATRYASADNTEKSTASVQSGAHASTGIQSSSTSANHSAHSYNNSTRHTSIATQHNAIATSGANTQLHSDKIPDQPISNIPNGSQAGNVRAADASVARNTSSHHLSASSLAAQTADATHPGADTRSGKGTDIYASAEGTTVRGRHTASRGHGLQPADSHMLHAASSAVAAAPAAVKPSPAPEQPKLLRHDTIQSIEIVARRTYDANTQKSVFRIDTFPTGRIVIDRVVPQPEETVAVSADKSASAEKHHFSLRRHKHAAIPDKTGNESTASVAPAKGAAVATSGDMMMQQTAQVVPAASPAALSSDNAAAAVAENAGLVSLSKFKVSSKRFALWDAEKIDAAINKFKFNLARVQMYPGLIGGINASVFTPNALGGFQAGLTSLFVLNDWWTVMAELKYIHRFNTGSTVRDDYKNVVTGTTRFVTGPNGEPYKYYEWQDESVDHYFNYEVVKTFEMPIALRYNTGRFYTQGGINLVYSTTVDAKEVTHARGDVASHNKLLPATHGDEPFITNSAPLIKNTDFGARFGTGYILGAGFMFTPAVYLDFRVTQTFWDNAGTSGAKQISKDLLRTPSIQLSLGYRFSSSHKD